MRERLTKWEGRDPDGTPRAVLAKREGSWVQNMDEALRKLARFEDEEERRDVEDAVPYEKDGGADDNQRG